MRIYPIGFGTMNPTTLVCTREQLGGTEQDMPRWGMGRGMGRDGRNFLRLDEEALRQVAETTDGAYFRASSADQLSGVLTDLPRPVERQLRQVELSVGLVAAAVLALLAAVALSVRWKVFP